MTEKMTEEPNPGCWAVLSDRIRLCERDAVDGHHCRQHARMIEKQKRSGCLHGPPWSGDPKPRKGKCRFCALSSGAGEGG